MKKNVAFIIPSLKSGGAERVLSTISMNLDKDINQYIFTWNGKDPDYEFNGEIIEINIQNSTSLIKNIGVLFKRVREIKKCKKLYNIDTCISHLEGPNIVNILSKYKEKTIVTVHSFQSKERKGFYGFIFKILIKLFYNRADKVVTVSKSIKEDLFKNFNIKKSKLEVIYNPFDCEKIKVLSEEELEEEYRDLFKNEVIIHVGRLSEEKGQIHLIKSFYELKKMKKGVKLVILGRGKLENELKKIVKSHKLEKDVLFLGFQKNPFKFISKSKIFALTSLYEGFPMCLVEAMACGTPVVSVDCKSGPRELLLQKDLLEDEIVDTIDCDYGILTPEFLYDIDLKQQKFALALKHAMERDLNDYINRGKKRASEFDVHNIIRKWNDIL